MPAIYKNGIPYAGSIGSAQTVTAKDPSGNSSNVQAELTRDSQGIRNITRSGTTFTATRVNGTTFSFTQQDNNTTYTGTTPINVSGSTVSHANSGVTSGAKGDTSNQTPAFGGTFKVPSGTVNATGHLTAFAEHTVKIPNAAATTAAAGLMSAADKAKLASIATSATRNASNATTAAAGLMSAADKIKLNSIATSATRNTASATTAAAGLMSAADKIKLNGIQTNATHLVPAFVEMYPSTYGGSTVIQSNVDTRLTTVILPKGTNFFSIVVRFPQSSVGRRAIWMSTSTNPSAAYGMGIMASRTVAPADGAVTTVQLVWSIWCPEQSTYYLNGFQNSGSSQEVYVRGRNMNLDT